MLFQFYLLSLHQKTKKLKNMDKKKVFTHKDLPEVFYQVIDEMWLDKTTFVVVFQEMMDLNHDMFHIEAEYHKDTNEITFTRVDDYDTVNASTLVSPCFKKQIEEYILRQVNVLREDDYLATTQVAVELKVAIPLDMSVGEVKQWVSDLSIEVKSPNTDKVRVLSVVNQGKRCQKQ